MPIITYTFAKEEMDEIQNVLEFMDIELGSIVNDLSEKKTIEKAGRLSSLQAKLNYILFKED